MAWSSNNNRPPSAAGGGFTAAVVVAGPGQGKAGKAGPGQTKPRLGTTGKPAKPKQAILRLDLKNFDENVQKLVKVGLDVPIWDPIPPIRSKIALRIHWNTSRPLKLL